MALNSLELTKEQVEKATTGVRFDAGKFRFDLVPVEPIEAYAAIMTMGAAKYADRNWELGMKWGRVMASFFRHWAAWMKGELKDKESGYPHTWHMLWNIATIVTYEQRKIGENDLFKEPNV